MKVNSSNSCTMVYSFLPTAYTVQREGNVFGRVCDSVPGGRGYPMIQKESSHPQPRRRDSPHPPSPGQCIIAVDRPSNESFRTPSRLSSFQLPTVRVDSSLEIMLQSSSLAGHLTGVPSAGRYSNRHLSQNL